VTSIRPGNPLGTTVTEDELSLSDNTTADSSTTKHGLLKKLDNVATNFMDGTGNFSAPPAGALVFEDSDSFSSAVASLTITPSVTTYIGYMIVIRTKSTVGASQVLMRCNADSTSGNYESIYCRNSGSAWSLAAGATSSMNIGLCDTNDWWGCTVFIYKDVSGQHAVMNAQWGDGFDADGAQGGSAGRWENTSSVITSITFLLQSGNLAQDSYIAVYGIKGS